MDAQTLLNLGTDLAFAGMLIMIVAIALILLSKSGKTGKARGGGVIIVGPIPIVFGTDKQSLKTILLLSIVLTTLLIVLLITLHFLSK
jgi:uncharacterized protein (TIGR00304 family)